MSALPANNARDGAATSPAEALSFLALLPHQRHNLVAIDPETGLTTGITRDAGHSDLGDFIARHVGLRNLYFSVNEPRAGAPDGKLKKTDIATIWAVFADLDAKGGDFESERARRLAQYERLRQNEVSAPSFAIDSGGGLQLFWVLAAGLPASPENVARAEAQGAGLASALEGDNVQNIDRLMRLPGTINLPNAAKRARHRVPAPATLLNFDGLLRTLEDIERFAPAVVLTEKPNVSEFVSVDTGLMRECSAFSDLPLDLRTRLVKLEREQPAFASAFAGRFDEVPMVKDISGSGQIFALAGFLRAAGFTANEFAQVAWVWPHKRPSAWMSDTSDDYVIRRDLQRTWADCENSLSVYQAKTRPEDDFEAVQEEPQRASGRYKFEFFDRITTDLKRRHLIKGVLLRVGTLGIIGQPGTGKSQLATHLAYSIAAGIPWCGRRVEQGAVICALGEGAEGFRGRVQALRQAQGGAPIPFIIVPLAPNLLSMADVKDFVLACKETMAELEGTALRMVCVDTLTAATPGMDQNSTEGMSRVVNALRHISRELDCVAAVIHHVGKDATRGARGSSVFNGDLDTELTVEDLGAGRFQVRQTKQRDFEKGAPLRFVQHQAVIGQDEDGDEVTAVYAVHDQSAANDDFDAVEPDFLSHLPAIQVRIAGGEWAKAVLSDQWVGLAIAEVLDWGWRPKKVARQRENPSRDRLGTPGRISARRDHEGPPQGARSADDPRGPSCMRNTLVATFKSGAESGGDRLNHFCQRHSLIEGVVAKWRRASKKRR